LKRQSRRSTERMKVLKTLLLGPLVLLLIGAACGLLLIRRGFRATTAPSAFETFLARTMRGLSVRALERGEKNPMAATPDTLQHGRQLFLTQCAACHGIDGGGGKTQMGLNLYPRVPDLRAASTQNLSDGEIHYIIENGVQLTGMPAWGNPHLESSGNSWKLVVFIRGLRPLNKQEQSQEAAAAGSGAVCRIAGLPEMPRGDLCALAENADGECGALSADASRRDHPRSRNQ